jgi:nanoRNase/pAp phosphatase (c-di-AMP/oligoRNAs hydrolase)
MGEISSLVIKLKRSSQQRIFIQTHNFPDHDAIASAYALQQLLSSYGIAANIIYDGVIQRSSLQRMLLELNITALNYEIYNLKEEDIIIVVDSCPGESNVTTLKGKVMAVIDHHDVSIPKQVEWGDIRKKYGSCSSIVFSYFEIDKIRKEVATALLIGINMDTAALTRNVQKADLQAYARLYPLVDAKFVNSVVMNFLSMKDLSFFRTAVNEIKIKNSFAFCYFPKGCQQNLLGILGDFFLSLDEINFVVLCAKNDKHIQFSMRNKRDDISCVEVLQEALKDIGFGGGHFNMAGGVITNLAFFKEKDIFERFYRIVGK